MTYPANPPPAWYAWTSLPARNRAGIFFPDDAITISFTEVGSSDPQSITGTWLVRNLDGEEIASGDLDDATEVTVGTAGEEPFDMFGWFRLYLTGEDSDVLFGDSNGSMSFCVWEPNAHMIDNITSDYSFGSAGSDIRTRGMSLMGPIRWSISDAANPGPGGSTSQDTLAAALEGVAQEKACYTNNGLLDTERPRKSFLSFPNGGVDRIELPNATNDAVSIHIYALDDTVDTTSIYVKAEAGSSSGTKITVRTPDAVTVVETYDNLASSAAATAAINATSTRIKAFDRGSALPTSYTATAIGRAKYNGVAQVVAATYPDITYFEGPRNEPTDTGADVAHQMMLFSAAVKDGDPAALTMGPNPVVIHDTSESSFMQAFADAGGTDYCDALSIHAYNSVTGGDFSTGRTVLENWQAFLSRNSLTQPTWMTELGHFSHVYGVLHPRRAARWWMITLLLFEQYGFPKEQIQLWYDHSHGYWDYPAFWRTHNSLDATVTCVRAFSAEVFGKTFDSALDFGTPGDDLYLGSRYEAQDGSAVAAILAASCGLGDVTFTVTGASSLTVVDAQGNTSSVAVTGGRATLEIGELPTYIRLPAGVTLTPYQHGAFPPIGTGSLVLSSTTYDVVASTNGTSTAVSRVHDGTLYNDYVSGPKPWQDISGTLPCTLTLTFPVRARIDHVVIWSGFAWQSYSALTDFDVQTLDSNESTWTTRATVTDVPSSFAFVADPFDSGQTRETYWDDRYVFDLSLEDPTVTTAVRLVIRGVTSGGEPDEDARAAGGQGWVPMAVVNEIKCYADDLKVHPRVVMAA